MPIINLTDLAGKSKKLDVEDNIALNDLKLKILEAEGLKKWDIDTCKELFLMDVIKGTNKLQECNPINIQKNDSFTVINSLEKANIIEKFDNIRSFADLRNFFEQKHPELKDDKDFFMVAVRQNGLHLQFASERLKEDREVVLAAVSQDGFALGYASEALRNDPEIVMAAVQQEGMALEHAPRFQDDRDVVLTAVQQNGMALEHAPRFQDDREVVLAAMRQDGFALEYASEALRDDRDVVLTAVKADDSECASALEFASERLKEDREVVLAAVQKNIWALEYVSEDLNLQEEYEEWGKTNLGNESKFATEKLEEMRQNRETPSSNPDSNGAVAIGSDITEGYTTR